jgi:hypothetical protein
MQTLEENRRYAESGCDEWTGMKTALGYGLILRRERGKVTRYMAHRAAWIVMRGPIPEGKVVCHKCDNRLCINPDHLFLGTQAENLADMKAKGRDRRNLGGRPHLFSKAERQAWVDTGLSVANIAKELGVTRSTVYRWMNELNQQ